MSDPIKPLPCPFCGDPIKVNKSGLAVHVSPGKCIIGAMGFASDYLLHATRWNTRTAPQVKPLVWVEKSAGLEATTLFGTALIYETYRSGWFLTATGMGQVKSRNFDTLEAAQKAFTADYDQLVLSALDR